MQHPGAGWEAARLRGCEHLYEEDSAASPRGKRTGSTSVMIFSRGACVMSSCFSCPHCFRRRWGWGRGRGGQCDLDRINTTLQIFLLRASTPSLSLSKLIHTERKSPRCISFLFCMFSVLTGGCCWCRRRLLEAALRPPAPIDYPPV